MNMLNIFMKKRTNIGVTKFVIGILLSNIIRLFRFIPNNDPIMAIMLPYAKRVIKNTKLFYFLLSQ
jgi:hypothetical protein